MLESEVSNASGTGSSESSSELESTSSSPKTKSSGSKSAQDESEPSIQYDPSKDNVVFSNNFQERETSGTNCDYCSVLDRENAECSKRIAELEEKCSRLEHFSNELNSKLELVGRL